MSLHDRPCIKTFTTWRVKTQRQGGCFLLKSEEDKNTLSHLVRLLLNFSILPYNLGCISTKYGSPNMCYMDLEIQSRALILLTLSSKSKLVPVGSPVHLPQVGTKLSACFAALLVMQHIRPKFQQHTVIRLKSLNIS